MKPFFGTYIALSDLIGLIAIALIVGIAILYRALKDIQDTQVKTNILLDKIGNKTTKEE
tara:strand:+ start:418 stop:594 length:177 start_codon:yes stop_codon:yes gene_type:complete